MDTVGITTKTFVDNYYTPHTERLHVVERFRLIDGGDRLEARIHVADPGAFTTPWDAAQRYRRVEPGRAENDVPLNRSPHRRLQGRSSKRVAPRIHSPISATRAHPFRRLTNRISEPAGGAAHFPESLRALARRTD